MNRAAVVGVLGALGAIAAMMPVPAAQDAPKSVTIRPVFAGPDNVFVVTGGGNHTLLMVGDTDVVLIDTNVAGHGPAIQDVVNIVADGPAVSTIINTHAHQESIGSNHDFPAAATIIAHDNTAARMRTLGRPHAGQRSTLLPTTTVGDKLVLFEGRDQIHLYYFGRGHTDGDLVVAFPGRAPGRRIAYMGDLFPAKALPEVDAANGGSGVAFPGTLARALAELEARGVDLIIPGRDPMLTTTPTNTAIAAYPLRDLHEYAEFNRHFVAAVRDAFAARKSPREAAAGLKLPNHFSGYDMRRLGESIETLYRELATK